jgi:hypothetical protein
MIVNLSPSPGGNFGNEKYNNKNFKCHWIDSAQQK